MKKLEVKKQEENEKLDRIKKELDQLHCDFDRLYDENLMDMSNERDKELTIVREKVLKTREEKYRTMGELSNYTREYRRAKWKFEQRKSADTGGGEKVIYQKSCPKPDCKGFLSQKGICGMCKFRLLQM